MSWSQPRANGRVDRYRLALQDQRQSQAADFLDVGLQLLPGAQSLGLFGLDDDHCPALFFLNNRERGCLRYRRRDCQHDECLFHERARLVVHPRKTTPFFTDFIPKRGKTKMPHTEITENRLKYGSREIRLKKTAY